MAESAAVDRCQEAFEALEDSGCLYCGGQLAIGTYKGTDAVLCDTCSAPVVRFW